MYVSKDFGTVRIVCDGSPFDVLYDVKVERLVNGDGGILHFGVEE